MSRSCNSRRGSYGSEVCGAREFKIDGNGKVRGYRDFGGLKSKRRGKRNASRMRRRVLDRELAREAGVYGVEDQ